MVHSLIMASESQYIHELATRVNEVGGRAMLVGGCVRDQLIGIEPLDWDVEVFGVEPKLLRELIAEIGTVNAVGEVFTVYKVGSDLDVAIPRREKKIGKGHRGFEVTGDPSMSFSEAARRRDFTINAILRDPLTGEIIDPYDGREDIRAEKLRAVSSETFGEDSLRVLRAAQFSARFGFELDEGTANLCREIDLLDLPSERIWSELEKLLLLAKEPSKGFELMNAVGALDQLFPEIVALRGVEQEPEWHPEGDVYVHTLLVIDEARKLIEYLPYAKKVSVMLGALCHDFGKPSTTEYLDGRWRSLGHEEAGVEPTQTFLKRININTLDGYDVKNQVIQLVRQHLKPGMFYKVRDEISDGAFRRLAQKVEPDLLYRVAKADSLGRNAPWVAKEKHFDAVAQDWFIERVRELSVQERAPEPILMGRHLISLGLQPSREFGIILNKVYELQLDGKIKGIEEAVDAANAIIAKDQ